MDVVSLSVSVARVECVGVVHLSSVCLSVCLSVCVCLCTYGLSDPALQNLQMSFAKYHRVASRLARGGARPRAEGFIYFARARPRGEGGEI